MWQKKLPPFKRPSQERSRNMRAIRSARNLTTERRLLALLAKSGLRGWKVRPSKDPGTPDFVFPFQRVIVFCDGCFFHGCPKCGHVPRTNAAYWRAKIARNQRRDRRISRELRSLGYSVLRIWECQLRDKSASCLNRIRHRLNAASSASIAC